MLGFIGLGVMGAPMCRNLAAKSGQEVRAFDSDLEALAQMDEKGVSPAESIRDVAEHADIVFLSLPGGPHVNAVCLGAGSLLTHLKPGGLVVDLSTTPVNLARDLNARFMARGIQFADAPVARTRAAAEAGTLSITVGALPELFARIEPLLAHAGSDVTHCGGIGTGQVVKLMNNMVLIEIGVAIAEALAVGAAAGVDKALLVETLAKGSADSFALRNHGLKAMLPEQFPKQAFSTNYALKDVISALELARETGFILPGARLAAARLVKARDAGHGDDYWPVISTLVDRAG